MTVHNIGKNVSISKHGHSAGEELVSLGSRVPFTVLDVMELVVTTLVVVVLVAVVVGRGVMSVASVASGAASGYPSQANSVCT